MLAIALLVANAPVFAQDTPPKYAGTYKIESWQDLESRKLFHFFYLQSGGAFLLGAEWPARETSRAAGEWRVSGDRLSLSGKIAVSTNKGRWQVPFRRTYLIQIGKAGISLRPIPEKNRFGLLGWPDSFLFHRTSIVPNLPGGGIPTEPEKLRALIDWLKN
ncbi:MAG: hypothetical protein O7C61_08380 [SAR324 cluster bacterium]|nr:hypothetical protein [SAR324 cluster bacterium]